LGNGVVPQQAAYALLSLWNGGDAQYTTTDARKDVA
jgi:hypothetical protein